MTTPTSSRGRALPALRTLFALSAAALLALLLATAWSLDPAAAPSPAGAAYGPFVLPRARVPLLLGLGGTLLLLLAAGLMALRRMTADVEASAALLRKREAQLAEAQRIARLGVWEVDLVAGTIVSSDAHYRMYGVEPGSVDFTLDWIFGRMHPADRERVRGALAEADRRGGPFEYEFRTVWPDGSPHVVRIQGVVEHDAAGRPVRRAGTSQDVTDARRREAAVRESEARYHGLFDAIQDAIVIAGTDRTIVEVNPAFEAMFGHGAAEVRGRTTAFMYADEADYEALGRALQAHQGGGHFLARHRYRRRDGRVFPAETGAYRLTDDAGALVGFVGVIRDVTERVEKERVQAALIAHLQEIDRMKDEFLSVLSHELRTPINAIMGFGSILQDEISGPLNPEQQHHVGKVLEGSETLLALVNDLLDMGRIRAGKLLLMPVPLDFHAVAAHTLAILAPLAAQRQVDLVDEVPADLPPLVGDEQRIGQVLANLVGNAIKFTTEGGVIRVRAAVADGRLTCEVTDTGVGIDLADQPRLFEAFTQLDSSYTRKAGGTGLGLSISRALVEAHGGRIGVRSAGEGKGSTFWFELPLAGPEGPP